MAHPQKKYVESDIRRGIRNSGVRSAHERFVDKTDDRVSFSDASLAKMKLDRVQAVEAANDAERAQTIEEIERVAYAEQLELENHRQQIAQQTAKIRQKIGVAKAPRITRFARFGGISMLVSVGSIQIVWAIMSVVWFGIAAARSAICDVAVISWGCSLLKGASSLIESATSIDLGILVSFEIFGWIFWGLILFITLIVVFCSLVFFKLQKINVLGGTPAMLGFVFSITANLIPFLNIIPWIEIWAGVWLVRSTVASLSNVPSRGKGS